jgi:hypothetical protein
MVCEITISTACCRLNARATQGVSKSSLLWQTLEPQYIGLTVAIARSLYQTQVIVYVNFDLMYIQSCFLSVLVGLGWNLNEPHAHRKWNQWYQSAYIVRVNTITKAVTDTTLNHVAIPSNHDECVRIAK